MSDRITERRRDRRIPLSFVSVDVCSAVGDTSPSEFCSVIDLSAGGMRFAARNCYETGRLVRLTFNIPGTQVPIRADATVVHQTTFNELLGTGVQFRNLGLAERRLIKDFVGQWAETKAFDVGPGSEPGLAEGGAEGPKGPQIPIKLKPGYAKSDSSSGEGNALGHGPEGSTQLLIKQCIRGDRRAQQQLFRQYRSSVYSLVCRLLGSDFDIDDVLQQVFVSIFRSLESFKGLSSLDTWIYRITVKVCTDQLRKKYRKRKLSVVGSVDDERSGLTAATEHTPHTGLERRELVERINAALARLTTEKRAVLIMYEMEGRSLEEIASVIEKPLGTVKSRLFHARREMEKLLRRYMGM